MGKRDERDWNRGFTQGYVCAVANIILTHGADTVAKDVLRGMGKINWKIIDEYDRDVLAKVGLAPLRRKAVKRHLSGERHEVRCRLFFSQNQRLAPAEYPIYGQGA